MGGWGCVGECDLGRREVKLAQVLHTERAGAVFSAPSGPGPAQLAHILHQLPCSSTLPRTDANVGAQGH